MDSNLTDEAIKELLDEAKKLPTIEELNQPLFPNVKTVVNDKFIDQLTPRQFWDGIQENLKTRHINELVEKAEQLYPNRVKKTYEQQDLIDKKWVRFNQTGMDKQVVIALMRQWWLDWAHILNDASKSKI